MGTRGPALHELRRHHETRPKFARLLARALPARAEWEILEELPFLAVTDAARLWMVGIKTAGQLIEAAATADGRRAITEPLHVTWIDPRGLEEWVERARLRRHLRPFMDDGAAVDRVESALHRLGIPTLERLSDQEPWSLSRKLSAVMPPGSELGHLIAPWAVAVWCQRGAPARAGTG